MTATEVDVTAVHAPGAAVQPYAAGAAEEYRARIVMDAPAAKALDDQLRAMQLAVLRKGSDYDTIPGMGDKPTLLKPGAEKLIQWFGFGFTSERGETERDSDGNRLGVTYRCTVTKGLPDGRTITIATCEGYAGYDEDRFYTSPEQAVAKAAKAKAREEYNAAKYNRNPNPAKWQFITEYRAPWNTVIKMAQKRAYVGAAIDATAAAGLFTQDLEDMTPPPGRDVDDDGAGSRAPAGDDEWEKSTPAKPRQDRATPEDTRPWAEVALKKARNFRSDAEADTLYHEAAARHKAGEIDREQQDRIQNEIAAEVTARHVKVMEVRLNDLSEHDDDWRDRIRGLANSREARELFQEVGQLKAGGVLDPVKAGRLGAAIIARWPRAVLKDAEATA